VLVTCTWRFRKAAFQYPLGAAPRTAVLVPWFRSGSRVRVFRDWSAEAAAFRPAALAATSAQVLALAAEPIALTHALIVFAMPRAPLLTAEERDRLWRAFGVPVFEQVVNRSGDLLAAECEAHDGLHVAAMSQAMQSNYSVRLARCGCGAASPRIAELPARVHAAGGRP
jgi:hypothetical protein